MVPLRILSPFDVKISLYVFDLLIKILLFYHLRPNILNHVLLMPIETVTEQNSKRTGQQHANSLSQN